MKKRLCSLLLCGLLLLCTACESKQTNKEDNSGTRTITDMAGRRVQVPTDIQKIYATGQPGVLMLYTTAPETLLGWCLALTEEEAQYIEPQYLGIPVLGLMQGSGNTVNREEILKRDPDLLLMVITMDQSSIEDADSLQEQLGIPVVMCDIALDKLPDCYRLVGELTGETERGEELAAYCEETMKDAANIAASIPENQRKAVYYAQGISGLQTVAKGSPHSEVIDLVGAENVVNLPGDNDGQVNINMEQVLSYDPQIIIASYSMGHTNQTGKEIFDVLSNGQQAWHAITAVRNGEVYSTPCLPYNFLDIPPSANRILGIFWLGNLLYPEYFVFDINEKLKDYYQLFYRTELSAEKQIELLRGAVRNR